MATNVDEFRKLVVAEQQRVFRFILKNVNNIADAEDIAQQTFVEAYRVFEKFRGDSSRSSWLFGIAINMMRNYWRRRKTRAFESISDEIVNLVPDGGLDPSEFAEQSESLRALERALATLDPDFRVVVVLICMEGRSYQEAAELLKVPIGTVRSRLSRARTALRSQLSQALLEQSDACDIDEESPGTRYA